MNSSVPSIEIGYRRIMLYHRIRNDILQ